MSRRSPIKGRRPLQVADAPPEVLELSRHLVQAQEEERKRISRELHDEAGQGLMVLRLYLGTLVCESPSPELRSKIEEAMGMLDRTIGDLRRIIARLSPRTLEELGLIAAIRKEARELSKNTGMRPRLVLPMEFGELDHEVEVALYRSVQEALHNVAKHSQAKNFAIRFDVEDGAAVLRVEDDGVGFSGKGTSRSRSFGLFGMRERIAALGGTVRIRSRKGTGTRITVMLPLPTSTARHAARADLLAGASGFSSKYEGGLEPQNNLNPTNTHHVHQVHSS
ncbi:MAG TPA: sensor histidine kinase [Terriglobales bacterium]|nr:sensor histidine kinase [Terriglobales bacterium]